MVLKLSILLLLPLILAISTLHFTMSGGEKLVSVDFEVFGKVQGVFFRKCTQDEAERLRLTGWVMNTSSGTVKGVIEGNKENVDKMKEWLQKTGSPHSKIKKAEFSTQTEIDTPVFSSFRVKS